MDISTFDVVLLNMLSFMGGIFTGMFAGIKLRNTMLKSRSRDNLNHMSHHTMTANGSPLAGAGNNPFNSQVLASAPLATALPENTSKQEIVIRTTE